MKRQQKGIQLKWLLLGMFFGSIGNSFVWPLTTIYMHEQLHESLTISGIVLLFYSGANVVGSYVSGILFDRFDHRRLMLGGTIVATIVIATMILFNGWPIYAYLLTAIGFFNGWIITMVNSFGTRLHHDGRYVFNMLYFANNLGMVIGTTIVGPLYQYDHGNISPLFSITTVLYILFILVVFFFFHEDPAEQSHQPVKTKTKKTTKVKIPGANLWITWTIFITLGVVWTMYEQWSSNLSVFMTDQGISMTKYSLLWTVNGILIVVFQLILTWLNRWYNNPYAQIFLGILTVGLSFVLLLFAKSYFWFVLAMVILTVGEATAFPTMPAVVNSLSPVEVKGKYQGILNAFSSLGKAVGPLFGGLVVGASSYHDLFIICAASIFVMEMIIIAVVRLKKEQTVNY